MNGDPEIRVPFKEPEKTGRFVVVWISHDYDHPARGISVVNFTHKDAVHICESLSNEVLETLDFKYHIEPAR